MCGWLRITISISGGRVVRKRLFSENWFLDNFVRQVRFQEKEFVRSGFERSRSVSLFYQNVHWLVQWSCILILLIVSSWSRFFLLMLIIRSSYKLSEMLVIAGFLNCAAQQSKFLWRSCNVIIPDLLDFGSSNSKKLSLFLKENIKLSFVYPIHEKISTLKDYILQEFLLFLSFWWM